MRSILSLVFLMTAIPAHAEFYSCQHYSEQGQKFQNWNVVITDNDGDGEYQLDVSLTSGTRSSQKKSVYYDYQRDGVTLIQRGKNIYTSPGRSVGVILTQPTQPGAVGAMNGTFFSEKYDITLPISCSLNGMESGSL